MSRFLGSAIVIVATLTPFVALGQPVNHPLDPLTWQEYWTTLDVLNDAGYVADSTIFAIIHLQEPSKGS